MIVHKSQEAIFFKDGKALDTFSAGRYTLKSENIPLLKEAIGLLTDGVSPFHCEVYFINKAYTMNVYWGTSEPLLIQNPVYNTLFKVQARGQIAVKVENSSKVLLQLVGTLQQFDQNTLITYFRGILIRKVKNFISDIMVINNRSFLEINSYLFQY